MHREEYTCARALRLCCIEDATRTQTILQHRRQVSLSSMVSVIFIWIRTVAWTKWIVKPSSLSRARAICSLKDARKNFTGHIWTSRKSRGYLAKHDDKQTGQNEAQQLLARSCAANGENARRSLISRLHYHPDESRNSISIGTNCSAIQLPGRSHLFRPMCPRRSRIGDDKTKINRREGSYK